MDRVWGKFLVQWWKAEEVRRGELRSWYRKMTSVVCQKVQQEMQGGDAAKPQKGPAEPPKGPACLYGGKCWYKEYHCPFTHPAEPERKAPPRPPRREETEAEGPAKKSEAKGEKEVECVPKTEGKIWKAAPDGSCMFHCVQGCNDKDKVALLRRTVAQHVQDAWDEPFNELITTAELLSSFGWTKEEYQRSVVMDSHWGDEWELAFLGRLTKQRLRVFREEKDHWQQFAEYGTEGPVCRLLFTPSRISPHYDLIIVREMWERECQEREAEAEAATVKEKAMAQQKKKQAEDEDRRRTQARQAARKQKVWGFRAMGLDAEMDDAEVIDLLTELSNEDT